MARKRSNHANRHSRGSERSYHEYLLTVPAPSTTRAEIVRLLRGGEDTYLELKVKFSNVEKLTAEIIALANTDGGALVFGVNDQLRIEGVDDPESVETELRSICTESILPPVFPYINKVAFDSGRRIVILEVDSHRRPHYNREYQYFLREGAIKRETTREELARIYGESPQIRFEQIPVIKSNFGDIDESLFWSFVRGVNPTEWVTNDKGFPTASVLQDFGLAAKYRDIVIPNIAGLLLFGSNERVNDILPQARIVLTRYSGDQTSSPIIEELHLRGNLVRLFEGSIGFLRRYVDLRESRPSRKAQSEEDLQLTRASYHENSVVEAVTNSIIHRDWSNLERVGRINVFENSLEFLNPMGAPALPPNRSDMEFRNYPIH